MVMFTCNHCGESLKKNAVDKHKFRCRRDVSVGCMDCFKDFDNETYNTHTQCVTELERYSGKDYVPKANQNKGQKKQEAWVDLVRGITEKKANLSSGVKKILETISSFDNIPRKKAKFLNFMKNSFRYMKHNELEEAWTLLEEAMKENKADNQVQNGQTVVNGKRKLEEENGESEENGTEEKTNGEVEADESAEVIEPPKKKSKKKKAENLDEPSLPINESEVTEATESPKKKTKQNNSETADDGKNDENVQPTEETQNGKSDKFSWSDAIRAVFTEKSLNEMNLRMLRKKLIKKFKRSTRTDWTDKVENKFNKKINKFKSIVVDNDKVRLID